MEGSHFRPIECGDNHEQSAEHRDSRSGMGDDESSQHSGARAINIRTEDHLLK
jgi:hypothetical protein